MSLSWGQTDEGQRQETSLFAQIQPGFFFLSGETFFTVKHYGKEN